jgi:hypothetical protein
VLLVETSNPAGGVTVKLPVRLLPETVKLVGVAVAVPYVVLTAAKVPLAVIVGVEAEAGAKAIPRNAKFEGAVTSVDSVPERLPPKAFELELSVMVTIALPEAICVVAKRVTLPLALTRAVSPKSLLPLALMVAVPAAAHELPFH